MPKHSKHSPGSRISGCGLVCTHLDGGWALPGGGKTNSELLAQQAADRIDAVIRANGGAKLACRVLPRPTKGTPR